MTGESPGLLSATQRRTADTRARAWSAIRRMDIAGQLINFVTVAREARTSRALLYRDPELRAEIERLPTGRSTIPKLPAAQRASRESLIQRLDGLRAEIAALRQENQILRTHLAATWAKRTPQPHRKRLPERRQLQIEYSHHQCRPDGGMTLIRERPSTRTTKSHLRPCLLIWPNSDRAKNPALH